MSDDSDNYFSYKGRRIKKFDYKMIDGREVAIQTEQWIKVKKKVEIEKKLREANIPERMAEYSFDSYVSKEESVIPTRLSKFVSEFGTKFHKIHLYLWGPNSTQKTTMASVIGKHLVEAGFSVQFVLMNNLLKMLQQETFGNSNEASVIERWKSCDFLIIDDAFDPRKVTLYKSGYQLPFLDSFLRERLEIIQKSTCFTSNIPVSEIGQSFGQNIEALIKRSVLGALHMKDSVMDRNDFDPESIWD